MSDLYDENADMRIPLAVDVAVCMDNYKRIVLSPKHCMGDLVYGAIY